jgi:hypothetical protein
VVSAGCLSIEDVRAQPALSLADLTVLADWIEDPLAEACGIELHEEDEAAAYGEEVGGQAESHGSLPGEETGPPAPDRARPSWPRGAEGRWLVAQEYRAAQEEGLDPVLAVMCATGHSRRRSLRLIAQARDAGFLTPRHARR